MGIKDTFNKGNKVKGIKQSGGGRDWKPVLLKVTDVAIINGGENDHPLVKSVSGDVEILEITMEDAMKTKIKEYQILRQSDKGDYFAYAQPRRVAKNGTEYSATLCYDIFEWAEMYKPGQVNKDLEFSKEKFLGLEFMVEVYYGESKDGRPFTVVNTDYTKLKDENYAKEQRESEEALESVSEETESAKVEAAKALPF
jgi:hypothetical protein